jgi:anaerobic selenocysteine-containing dehydrogenase
VVWIESRRGRVQAKARLYEGARPGVVHLPLGYGSRNGSPWACRGADSLGIGDLILDPVTNRPVNGGTCVKVYKA